ncbi:1-propanol dehydrogenase PduQ [Clostridium gasigenes]|uniref:Alcohol dehydrogenase, class IV n=1 Tax=Clostridium gasigenes TaxID=94869 RepID=A0A1H0VA54_9CLOT|nr:1-propanol dehydrogenase PduQ [Clostridium gasigenes]MBU3088758.1 iron-containing alcohol dehydrogenase [Clostridium gasigenes]SDP75422.1 Alcohol dehydrogenase, class IV [Clostridium gasigenes]
MNKFSIKTKIYFGEGSLSRLSELNYKKVMVITDPFMVKSGTIKKITEQLEKGSVEYIVFDEIVPDPPIETVVVGVNKMMEFKPEAIVALGGGSAIDAAKAIKEFALKITKTDDVYFIAIPTTSGTGSEVTSFSVITDKEKNIKYPLVSDSLLPNEAILDPELVKTVPNFITADTGMDVLTHSLEAYVSTKSNDFTDALAEKSIKLVSDYLLRAYKDGNNTEAREKMHSASCLAGMAFNEASLGLNHGIAHGIGGKLHIAHGRTNSILLPHIVEYNADLTGYTNCEYSNAAIRYANVAKILDLPCSNVRTGVKSLINWIVKLQKEMNMPRTLKECGKDINEINNSIDAIAESALVDGCTITNPRVPNKNEIIKILNIISN